MKRSHLKEFYYREKNKQMSLQNETKLSLRGWLCKPCLMQGLQRGHMLFSIICCLSCSLKKL